MPNTAAQTTEVKLSCERCHATYQAEVLDGIPSETKCPRCRKRVLKPGNASGVVRITETTQPATQAAPPQLSPERIQTLVNDLMFKHGVNLVNRGDLNDLLAPAGLQPSHLEPGVLTKAKNWMEKKLMETVQQPNDSKLEWATEPADSVYNGATFHFWTSSCGRYRVARKDSPTHDKIVYTAEYRDHEGRLTHIEHSALGIGYPKFVARLDQAFEMAEKFHTERYKVVRLTSNKEQAMEKAAELGLAKNMPVIDKIGAPKTEKVKKEPKEKKEKVAKQPGQPSKPRGVTCLGHSARRVVMWMGLNGWDFGKVKTTMANLGVVDLSESSLRTAWTDGKNPKYSKPAEVTTQDIEALEKASGASATKVEETSATVSK